MAGMRVTCPVAHHVCMRAPRARSQDVSFNQLIGDWQTSHVRAHIHPVHMNIVWKIPEVPSVIHFQYTGTKTNAWNMPNHTHTHMHTHMNS